MIAHVMLIAKEFMVENYGVEAWDKVIYIPSTISTDYSGT